MSTKTWQGRAGKLMTDPKFIPATRGLTRWVNKMAGRGDLTVRVLAHTSDSPARFIQNEAVIDFNEKVLSRIDPKIAGSQEFVALHPAEAGLAVHEACHARCSYLIDLTRVAKNYGSAHALRFQILEESRCERQSWIYLTRVEQFALQSSVMDIILGDINDEETAEETTANAPLLLVLRTLGLVAGRMDAGIVDTDLPKGKAIKDALINSVGEEYFQKFWDIAREFSLCEVGNWNSDEKRMHELVQNWLELEQQLLDERDPDGENGRGKEGEEGEDGQQGTQSGAGKKGEGKNKEKTGGTGRGEGEGEKEGGEERESGSGGAGEEEEKEGQGEQEKPGEDGEKQEPGGEGDRKKDGKKPVEVGSDDEGVEGDGSGRLSKNEQESGGEEAGLGTYKGGTHNPEEEVEALIRHIREATVEVRQINGSRLGVEIRAIHRATAHEHAERRKRNDAARKKWQQR